MVGILWSLCHTYSQHTRRTPHAAQANLFTFFTCCTCAMAQLSASTPGHNVYRTRVAVVHLKRLACIASNCVEVRHHCSTDPQLVLQLSLNSLC